ncbi:2-succinyl-6-hydroxy-2,4-cyclohexadiene-1-carboxylate synthase [Siminovitchia fortis]|uniref:Putative 2-succinyl-6-hydroxy-2,4-cyclohexadiene-1-carboxylate synthase n=1 Tax=Siminovitchia fortis TaxID=254758 RepID=A0A443ILH6_9BACI|nr:2-succinyl-6-hydroxy-2,4-cyclohexadiene-1-carboxylate synthase [Siminovitchia fortis]RWR05925.1 2-succinyl-6-hydroxy-2,4-cyclohexadiene-1-carboxylate synthase [Siminovitchia fortis]WHY82178.1 2-succinyl-6-hydroxy-2,4-cyclohexadiene-1-carboxylate synthase [Siminovitchia fortis]
MLIHVNHVKYHVELTGKEESPAVILLHGFTGDHTTWNSLTNALKDFFQVVAIDLLGHGKTDSPEQPERYVMENAAKDIVSIMDQLKIDKAHLLGYSMGGRLALGTSILFPERFETLMLESASPGLKTEQEKIARIQSDESLAAGILEQGVESFVNYWENIPLFQTQKRLPSAIRDQIRTQRLQNDPIGLANSLIGFGTGRQLSWWDKLQELDIPVLLMCGKQDEKFCKIAAEMNRLFPKAKIMEFNDAGHAIHVEEPKKFDTIVKEFLIEQEQLS